MKQRTKEEKAKRSYFIEQEYLIFSEHQKIIKETTFIDPSIICNVVSCYFDDIDRLKHYHNQMKLADFHKVAAYTAKWIIFLKPIQLKYQIDSKSIHKYSLLANELFALHFVSSILGIENFMNLNKELRFNLLYTLRYRHFTGRSLSTLMYILDELNKSYLRSNNN
ncbi:MAG: hypothetical protein HQK63_00720 [Desulfamplus sp.]|nr:hypothetical protein [Desulfamplus sp.]